jgi:preprotein translocase subunit SecF
MGIQILGKTNIDFIGKRKYAFILSAVLVSVGMLSLVQVWRGQANLGIDFAGGTSVQLKFEKPFQLDKARHALEVNGFKDSELQQFTEGNKLLIQLKKSTTEGKLADKIVSIFSKEFADNKFVIDSTTEIGPKVGKTLRDDALIAVIVSAIGMIVYLAWRFEFVFGVAAAVATFHDVLGESSPPHQRSPGSGHEQKRQRGPQPDHRNHDHRLPGLHRSLPVWGRGSP